MERSGMKQSQGFQGFYISLHSSVYFSQPTYTHPQNLVTIQIQMLDTNNLAGQMTLKDIPKTIKFTPTPQTKDKGHK
jgi:hypothetical protein